MRFKHKQVKILGNVIKFDPKKMFIQVQELLEIETS